ncbi:MAG TPA: DNA (cytosine-5-)-methyltransferase [Cytophagaceae bacterium]|jgi:DNA-cytosine methyltransferase|nr:DNA (cytosine-5-)-methyltransferase [Cytophagaceae bacterium]
MKTEFTVLSLFDGVSCARLALDRVGISPIKYYASEINKYAMRISEKNYPDIIQLGNVKDLNFEDLPPIDFMVFGFPCTDLSSLNSKREGLEGKHSGLLYDAIKVMEQVKPKYFLAENVNSMSNENKKKITELLKVEPIMINSKLVSAQQRTRLYWTNIPISQPEDKEIYLKDVIDSGYTEKEKSACITATYASSSPANYFFRSERQRIFEVPVTAVTTTASGFTCNYYYTPTEKIEVIYNKKEKYTDQKARNLEALEKLKKITRKLTPTECERLQTLPEHYTRHCSDNQRYAAIGNGFTVDVIAHILSFIPRP